jgi:hypothetical protein
LCGGKHWVIELFGLAARRIDMEKPSTTTQISNYRVKSIEPIMTGSDVQARLFTLAPGEQYRGISAERRPITISY